jgi:alanine racemase
MSLRARPLRVTDVPKGWGISYGPSWEAVRPSRIATLPLGYGDGWPREASNRAEALVRGLRVPLVGTVAMDAVMADVTDVPEPTVTTDDVFTLLGADGTDRIDAHELARSRTTIAWEVVTAMSARLTRVYYLAAVPVGVRSLSSLVLTGPRDTWPASRSGTGTSATWRSTRS